MEKVIITYFLLLFSLCDCYSTPQIGDRLIYKGDTIRIYPFILEQYINNSPLKDVIYSQIDHLMIKSSVCWHGFISVFELRNDSLFLQKVYGRDNIDLLKTFGIRDNIFVSWYSGTLTSPKNLKIYEHDNWGGHYEFETDFLITKGILKRTKIFHNIILPSEYSKSTVFLVNFIKSNIDYSRVKPVDKKITVITRIEDVDDNGKITKVSVIKGHDGYNEEAIRVIKSIPQWQVMWCRGVKLHIRWTIPVTFEPRGKNQS